MILIMSGLKQKPKWINFIALIFLALIVSACSSTLSRSEIQSPERIETGDSFSDLVTRYEHCSGSGWISYSGDQNGRLGFSFTCTGDSAYYKLKDLFGRTVMFIELNGSDFRIWDKLNNVIYSRNSFPEDDLIPLSIATIPMLPLSWGIVLEENGIGIENDQQLPALIAVNYSESNVGLMVENVVLKTTKSNQELIIHFAARNWGKPDRKLIRPIPESIPAANFNWK